MKKASKMIDEQRQPFFNKFQQMDAFKRVVTAVFVALMFLPKPGEAVSCYLCSYSPKSKTSSRLDYCTDGNFTSEVIDARECEIGCATVSVFDKNGEMEIFYRNCARKNSEITNRCEPQRTMLVSSTVCTCDWHFCNAASALQTDPLLATLIFTTTLTILLKHSLYALQ